MTNREIGVKLGLKIKEERTKTNEVLLLINLALERRTYLEWGFSSMFDWLVRGFGYSNAAAYRQIEAARLMKAVPEISSKLETGQVNLSTMSNHQERKTVINENTTRLSTNISSGMEADLKRAKELLSHTYPARCNSALKWWVHV